MATSAQTRLWYNRIRLEAIAAYGGECVECGEDDEEVLVFDHVNDDGHEHRRQVKPANMYNWLKKNGYPDIVQLLCANCNLRKERRRLRGKVGSSGN